MSIGAKRTLSSVTSIVERYSTPTWFNFERAVSGLRDASLSSDFVCAGVVEITRSAAAAGMEGSVGETATR